MNLNIKYDRLFSAFEYIMVEYSHLDYSEKSYDYYDSSKLRYADLDVVNYYLDIDNDYGEDNWIMQYQDSSGDEGRDEDLPILRYGNYYFNLIESMFGEHFEPLLKEWFEKTYKHKVKTIEKY